VTSCSETVRDAEQQFPAGGQPRGDQVLDDFVLCIEGDGAPGQRTQVDTVALAAESQFNAVMQCALAAHAFADAGIVEDIHRALLQHAGTNGRFDIVAAARLKHDRRNAVEME
jgi:hypothetical protein